jgi:hypothetical protein
MLIFERINWQFIWRNLGKWIWMIQLTSFHFWKGNQFLYPEVAIMARDVLSIHVSTIASESTFSFSGRVTDQYRSSLKLDIVEALICIRDWLYGDKCNICYLHI